MRRTIFAIVVVSICAATHTVAAGETKMQKNDQVNAMLADEQNLQHVHMHFSADCFNKCWKYIEMKTRSKEDTENMLLLANASLWHWKQRKDCKPKNLSIAYWQLARVNSLAGDLALAKHYGYKCLDVSLVNELDPFFLGYAHEALADAMSRNSNADEANKHLAHAKEQLGKVKDDFDKGLLKADIQRITQMLEKKQ